MSAGKLGVGVRSEGGGSSSSVVETRIAMRHQNLAEIAAALDEYFGKAADAGVAVSGLLETGREQLDSSFRQLKSKQTAPGHCRNFSSSFRFFPPKN